jgi:O-antigen ligase
MNEIGPPSAARSLSGAGASAWRQRLLLAATISVLVVGGLLGGGRGGPGDTAAQLVALLLLAWLAAMGLSGELHWRAPIWVRCLPLLAVALPILQLLPIPEAIWSLGQARAELGRQLDVAGVNPVHVLSLDPSATESVFLGLLPAVAVYLSVLTFDRRARKWMLGAIFVLALLNICFGMAQLGQGRESPLRLYFPTNADQAVGLFANRNHLACLLAMCLPLAVCGTAWALVERLAGRRVSPFLVVAGCGFVMLLIVGITMTGSRAGLLLGMLAVLGSWPIAMSLRRQKGPSRVLAMTLVLAVVLAIQFSMVGVLQRLEGDRQEDGRWEYARVTAQAAHAYAPLGSGLGTFRQAYQPFEAKHAPTNAIINHAHNDYLELWLEGGWLALLALGVGMLAWLARGWALLRRSEEDGDAATQLLLARTAWLGATLGLVHSALDYPFRTTANLTVFAIFAAIAFSDWRTSNRAGPT